MLEERRVALSHSMLNVREVIYLFLKFEKSFLKKSQNLTSVFFINNAFYFLKMLFTTETRQKANPSETTIYCTAALKDYLVSTCIIYSRHFLSRFSNMLEMAKFIPQLWGS